MFVSGYHVVYYLLGSVSSCKVKKALKLALDFIFRFYFFIVRLPHRIPDLSLNAERVVNKFYVLFNYIPHFMTKLCRMCSKYLLCVLTVSGNEKCQLF